MIDQSKMRAQRVSYSRHRGPGGEGIDSNAGQLRNLRRTRDEVAQYRRNIGAAIGAHADKGSGWNLTVSRIDDDTHCGEGQLVLGGDPRREMRFHVNRGRPGRSVQFPLPCRLGDRFIDTGNWGMNGARNHAQQLARPDRIRGADAMRFANGRGDDPISGAQMRSKAPCDAKADHAAVALPNGAVGDHFQVAPGRAAHHPHPGGGGNSRLESQAHKCDDETTVRFDGRIDNSKRVIVVGVSYQSIYESTPGEIQLGCHYKPYPLRLLPNLDHAPNSVLADVLGFCPANHRVST
jgi:hypothetical protein